MRTLILALCVAACGDGNKAMPDAAIDAGVDDAAAPDAPVDAAPPAVAPCTTTLGFPGAADLHNPNGVRGAGVGDFNGDGRLDLALLDGSSTLALYHGRMNGELVHYSNYTMAAAANVLAVGRLAGDTIDDVVVASDSQAVTVLLGTTAGFATPTEYATANTGAAIALARVDGDTLLDVLVGGSQGLTLLRGGASGTLQTAASIYAAAVTDIAVIDADGDTDADVVLADGSTNLRVGIGAGNGTFAAATSYAAGTAATHVAAADVNGDSRPDLIIGAASAQQTATLWLGSATGVFQSGATYTAGHGAIYAGDVDGDNDADFASRSGLMRGTNTGSFTVEALPGAPTPLAFVDLDNNNRDDIVAAGTNVLRRLHASATGTFVAGTSDTETQGSIFDVTTGDFDADAIEDVAVLHLVNNGPGSAVVLHGASGGTLAQPEMLGFGTSPTSLVAADFDRDGKADLAAVHPGTSYSSLVSVLLRRGSSFARTELDGHYASRLVLGDFDRDGVTDIARGSESSVNVLRGRGDGTFFEHYASRVGGLHAIARDLDQDGDVDLVGTSLIGSAVFPSLNRGNGTFLRSDALPSTELNASIAAGDLDGDTNVDLVVRQASLVLVFLGTGTGTFTPGDTVALDDGPVFGFGPPPSIALADLDGDGKLDLIAPGAMRSEVLVLRGRGNGTFDAQSSYAGPAGATFVRAVDVDHDNRIDLVAAGSTGVRVLINRCF